MADTATNAEATMTAESSEEINIISEPQNMKNVREAYKELQCTIRELGSNIGNVLENQENEFVTTFKSKMKSIQSVYDDMKQDISKREQAIQDNVMMKQLEEERDWYKKQALYLDETLVVTKKRESELKVKADEIEQDRSWLSNQLKVVMKQKNMLERQKEQLDIDNGNKDDEN